MTLIRYIVACLYKGDISTLAIVQGFFTVAMATPLIFVQLGYTMAVAVSLLTFLWPLMADDQYLPAMKDDPWRQLRKRDATIQVFLLAEKYHIIYRMKFEGHYNY